MDFWFSRKYDFISLFIGIRTKLHFPLESPFTKFNFFVDLFTSSTFEKREVSFAKILHIVTPSGRLFM